ncbi:hypothetical protein ID866_7701 [Astraeus odoratus]|nr:hypothetical protein ID866_7701 [Astraeus odoratus]
MRERVLGILAIVGAFTAMWGLILLSGFDTKRYTSLHRIFLLVFMLGVALSAVFTVVEFRWIAQDYQYTYKLRRAYIAKGIIASALISLAIAFGITLFYAPNVGGVIEWIIAFGFTLYILTFCYDLRMTKETDPKLIAAKGDAPTEKAAGDSEEKPPTDPEAGRSEDTSGST